MTITKEEIYKRALQVKKSKHVAFYYFMDLLDQQDFENMDYVQADKLASLYAFFTPASKTAKAKTPFQWVFKATSSEHHRHNLQHVYATGEYIVATDGHRLHWLEDTRKPGFYDINEQFLGANIANFPDWKRVIPSDYTHSEPLRDIMDYVIKPDGNGKSDTVMIFGSDKGHGINRTYLEQVIEKSVEGWTLHLCEDISRPIKLEHDDGRKAAIMPKRV